MVKIVSFGWTLTAVFFLVSLAFIYANVGVMVNLDGTTASISDYSLHRDTFFYVMVGGFLAINIVLRGLGLLLQRVPVTNMKQKTFFNSELFKTRLVAWTISFSGVVNIALILSLIIIGFANYAVNPQSTSIGWFSYLGFGLIALWLVGLVLILLGRRAT
ncbi:MAG TPA: hypothetical protein DCE41_18195 [Cytophagales bacterium]|nr:hypothetical protein [Cytophagales bacterium]HAA21744.1 hypothetical protein [Cytophagales bacterium]HAP63595.1 hypothetical protein [Cytophagales bacterium]